MVYIHRKIPNTTIICGVKFYPGINTVSDAEYEKMKSAKNKALDGEIACGNMYLGGTVDSPRSEAATPGLSIKERAAKIAEEMAGVNVAKAREIINGTGDGYLLRELLNYDGRKGVQEGIEKRIKEISVQAGSDLAPASKPAPNGDGSDFDSKIGSDKVSQSGTKGHSAIPALNDELM